MTLTTHTEDVDQGGGRHRLTVWPRPIAYAGKRLTNLLRNAGDPSWGHDCAELLRVRLARASSAVFPLAFVEHGGSYAAITCLGAAVREGVRDGGTVTYRGALPDTDIRYTLGGHLCKFSATCGPNHPEVIRFALRSGTFDPASMDFGQDLRLRPFTWRAAGAEDEVVIPHTCAWEKGRWVLTVPLPAGAGVLDPTITVQPGPADGVDTEIRSSNPNGNYGNATTLSVEPFRRSLVRFTVPSLPAGATVHTATVALTLATLQSGDLTSAIYRTLPQWTEGATWNSINGITAWATPGANNSTLDYAGSVLLGTALSPNGNPVGSVLQYSTAALASLVQSSAGGTVSLVVRDYAGDNRSTLISAEYTFNAAYRPYITYTYTEAPAGCPAAYARRLARRRM
jgi:hypothetical protein